MADLFSGVMQLATLFVRRLGPIFQKANVTPQQWLVLTALAEAEAPSTLVALARRLSVTKQNMTGMIARLEQLGLTERHDDPNDLRSSRVQVTRRGKGLIDKLRPSYEQWLKELGRPDLNEREMLQLTRSVERLVEILDRSS